MIAKLSNHKICHHNRMSFEDSDLSDPVKYASVLIGTIHVKGVLPPEYKIHALIRDFDYYSLDRMMLFTQLISALANYRDFTPFAITLLEKITPDLFIHNPFLKVALHYINPDVLPSNVILECFKGNVDLRKFQILIHAGFLRNLNTMQIKILLDTVASHTKRTGHVLLRPVTELIVSGGLNCEISLDKNVKFGYLTFFSVFYPAQYGPWCIACTSQLR